MSLPLDEIYLAAHRRLDTRVRALLADGRPPADVAVPACPGWSVHGVVSHLSGIAVDALAGRLTGIPDDAWTAGQVAERADRRTEDVLDEWAARAEPFAAVVAQRRMIPPAADVLTHEGDVAEALGDPVPPADGWRPLASGLGARTIGGIDRPGTLTVATDGETWTGGDGSAEPAARVEVEPWELFRGMLSRRSGAQMRAWPWDGDPGPWLEGMTVFGVREDDQPRPA